MDRGINSRFYKKDIQKTSKCMKRYSTASVTRGMQINTAGYHFTLARMAKSKKVR